MQTQTKLTEDIYSSRAYKQSRSAYSAQCLFEYFISILCSDAFLAKLLKDIGLSDAVTGLLSSFISFTFFFGLLAIPLAGRLKKVKKPVITLDTLSQLLFAALYAVPFLPLGTGAKGAVVTGLLVLAYLTLYLNTSICYKWGNSFVSPEKRGSFSATKEMISLIAGVFFTLLMGFVTDSFENKGNLHGAFIFIGLTMIVTCGCNFTCLELIKEKPLSESGTNQSPRKIIEQTFLNRRFRNAMILTAVTEAARYFTLGFLGTFKTVDLGFSVSEIQMINVAANLGRFAVSKPFGRFSDKKGFANGYFAGNLLSAAAFLFGIFTSTKTRLLILPFTMLFNMSLAGTNQNTFNMAYSYVDDEYILSAMTVNNSVRGICGFLSSLAGSRVLSAVQQNGSRLFGRAVFGQQVLSAGSLVMSLAALAFNKCVVSKQTEDKK